MTTPKNIVVTGGNSGIGYETVKALYEEGHNVIFGSRSVSKNQEAVSIITKKQGGSLISFPLDLSAKKSIEDFVKNVKSKFKQIDILINNAGLVSNEKKNNEDGIEYTLAVNHFGVFYLTYLFWNDLQNSPEARVINVSSELHFYAASNYLEDIECSKKSFGSTQQYNISKLFNVLFTVGLNNLINKKGLNRIKTASLHPGLVETNIGNDQLFTKVIRVLCCCLVEQPDVGARTSLYLSRVPFGDFKSGEYYNDKAKWEEMDKRGRKQEDVAKLWAMSEKVYGIKFQ